jgi:hypothetical protein
MSRIGYALSLLVFLGVGSCKKKADPIPLGPSFVAFQATVPANTPTSSVIRVVGNQLGTPPYDPAKSDILLTRQADGTYRGVAWTSSLPSEGLRFRFVRGITNAFVEKDRGTDGSCVNAPERIIPREGAGGQVFEFTIVQWADLTPNCN